MRNVLHLICLFLCMGIMNLQSIAQIHTNLVECNNIIVTNDESLKTSKKIFDFSFILEKHIGNDIWMSLKKKNNDKRGTEFLNLKPGLYRVKLSVSDKIKDNGESVLIASEIIEIRPCQKNISLNTELIIDLFPNPGSDFVTINIINPAEGEIKFSLFNPQGKEMKSFIIEADNFKLPVFDLVKGVYFIELIDSDRKVAHKKLLVD